MSTKDEVLKVFLDRFGMPKTSDFQNALREGLIPKAEEWLAFIIENKIHFSQYHPTWGSWLRDRNREIAEARTNNGKQIVPTRTKDEAKADLREKFGFDDTAGFRECLVAEDFELAKKWLDYIESSPNAYPQYIGTWTSWLYDRKKELDESMK